MKPLFLLVACLLGLAVSEIPPECLKVGPKSFPPAAFMVKCFYSVDISEKDKASILDTTRKFFNMYSYKDIVRDTPSSPPLQPIKFNIDDAITNVEKKYIGQPVSAWKFYEDIQQSIFLPLRDAHTMMIKPPCFDGIFMQPFKLGAKMNDKGEMEIFVASLSTNISLPYWPNSPTLYKTVGKTITKIGGKSAFDAIFEYSSTHSVTSKDFSVSFNDCLFVHFLWRPLRYPYNILTSNMTYTFSDGTELNIPWAVNFTGNLKMCPRKSFASSFIHSETERLIPMDVPSDSIRVFPLNPNSDTLVVKVPNFQDRDIWSKVKERTPTTRTFTKLILDLRQNGGGIVCEGLHLIEYLTSPPPSILYDLRRSQNSDALVNAAVNTGGSAGFWGPFTWSKPNSTEYPYKEWYGPRKLNRGGVEGSYSELLEFGDRRCGGAVVTSTKFEKIILLTDGHCGSTCAVFSNLLQSVHSHVRAIAVGGLPNQKEMSFSTFAGGIVLTDQALFSANERYGISGDFVPQRWPTDVTMRVPHLELYLNRNSPYPAEFTFIPADYRILSWPSVWDPSSFSPLYNQVNQFFDKKDWDQKRKR